MVENKEKEATNVITIGTTIKKKFGKHVYTGTVKDYNNGIKLYGIKYSDGDYEEMTQAKVNKYKCTANPKVVNQLRTRRALHLAQSAMQKVDYMTHHNTMCTQCGMRRKDKC